MTATFQQLAAFLGINPGSGQIILTILSLLGAFGVVRLSRALIAKKYANKRDASLLALNVGIRNTVVACVSVLLIVIWLGEIKHVAVSIAALAAAIILASREYLLNLYGTLMRLFANPFSVGDMIEIQNFKGKVVDIDGLTFKLLVYGESGQATSRTVEIPNSVLLSNPVVNHNELGSEFCFAFSKISLPVTENVVQHADLLEASALTTCEPWLGAAGKWLETKSSQYQMDFPKAGAKVLIASKDYKQIDLVLRFVCRQSEKLDTEQKILRNYFENVSVLAGRTEPGSVVAADPVALD